MKKSVMKELLKTGGKSRGVIQSIYDQHSTAAGNWPSDSEWNRAMSLAFAEAAGIPCSFSFNNTQANVAAELLDQTY